MTPSVSPWVSPNDLLRTEIAMCFDGVEQQDQLLLYFCFICAIYLMLSLASTIECKPNP